MHRNMPVDLVLVRHGQSEGNLAQKLARQGQLDLWTSEFRERHNSLYRLTDTGRMQAHIAGEYIRRNISPLFDKYFTSEYVRAMETAAALELPHARWATEVYLRERDRGVLANKPHQERVIEHKDEFVRKERDAFYWQPSGGESIANLCLRVDRVLENLGENCSGLRVIVVCHGGVIKSFRALIERVRSTEYRSHDKIHNCQIVWYTRRDPKTGYISSKYNWVKSLCPWDLHLSRYTNEWREIRRHVYSNVELLRSIGQVVQLVNWPLDSPAPPAVHNVAPEFWNYAVDCSDSSDSGEGFLEIPFRSDSIGASIRHPAGASGSSSSYGGPEGVPAGFKVSNTMTQKISNHAEGADSGLDHTTEIAALKDDDRGVIDDIVPPRRHSRAGVFDKRAISKGESVMKKRVHSPNAYQGTREWGSAGISSGGGRCRLPTQTSIPNDALGLPSLCGNTSTNALLDASRYGNDVKLASRLGVRGTHRFNLTTTQPVIITRGGHDSLHNVDRRTRLSTVLHGSRAFSKSLQVSVVKLCDTNGRNDIEVTSEMQRSLGNEITINPPTVPAQDSYVVVTPSLMQASETASPDLGLSHYSGGTETALTVSAPPTVPSSVAGSSAEDPEPSGRSMVHSDGPQRPVGESNQGNESCHVTNELQVTGNVVAEGFATIRGDTYASSRGGCPARTAGSLQQSWLANFDMDSDASSVDEPFPEGISVRSGVTVNTIPSQYNAFDLAKLDAYKRNVDRAPSHSETPGALHRSGDSSLPLSSQRDDDSIVTKSKEVTNSHGTKRLHNLGMRHTGVELGTNERLNCTATTSKPTNHECMDCDNQRCGQLPCELHRIGTQNHSALVTNGQCSKITKMVQSTKGEENVSYRKGAQDPIRLQKGNTSGVDSGGRAFADSHENRIAVDHGNALNKTLKGCSGDDTTAIKHQPAGAFQRVSSSVSSEADDEQPHRKCCAKILPLAVPVSEESRSSKDGLVCISSDQLYVGVDDANVGRYCCHTVHKCATSRGVCRIGEVCLSSPASGDVQCKRGVESKLPACTHKSYNIIKADDPSKTFLLQPMFDNDGDPTVTLRSNVNTTDVKDRDCCVTAAASFGTSAARDNPVQCCSTTSLLSHEVSVEQADSRDITALLAENIAQETFNCRTQQCEPYHRAAADHLDAAESMCKYNTIFKDNGAPSSEDVPRASSEAFIMRSYTSSSCPDQEVKGSVTSQFASKIEKSSSSVSTVPTLGCYQPHPVDEDRCTTGTRKEDVTSLETFNTRKQTVHGVQEYPLSSSTSCRRLQSLSPRFQSNVPLVPSLSQPHRQCVNVEKGNAKSCDTSQCDNLSQHLDVSGRSSLTVTAHPADSVLFRCPWEMQQSSNRKQVVNDTTVGCIEASHLIDYSIRDRDYSAPDVPPNSWGRWSPSVRCRHESQHQSESNSQMLQSNRIRQENLSQERYPANSAPAELYFSSNACHPASFVLEQEFDTMPAKPLNIPPLPVPYTASPPRTAQTSRSMYALRHSSTSQPTLLTSVAQPRPGSVLNIMPWRPRASGRRSMTAVATVHHVSLPTCSEKSKHLMSKHSDLFPSAVETKSHPVEENRFCPNDNGQNVCDLFDHEVQRRLPETWSQSGARETVSCMGERPENYGASGDLACGENKKNRDRRLLETFKCSSNVISQPPSAEVPIILSSVTSAGAQLNNAMPNLVPQRPEPSFQTESEYPGSTVPQLSTVGEGWNNGPGNTLTQCVSSQCIALDAPKFSDSAISLHSYGIERPTLDQSLKCSHTRVTAVENVRPEMFPASNVAISDATRTTVVTAIPEQRTVELCGMTVADEAMCTTDVAATAGSPAHTAVLLLNHSIVSVAVGNEETKRTLARSSGAQSFDGAEQTLQPAVSLQQGQTNGVLEFGDPLSRTSPVRRPGDALDTNTAALQYNPGLHKAVSFTSKDCMASVVGDTASFKGSSTTAYGEDNVCCVLNHSKIVTQDSGQSEIGLVDTQCSYCTNYHKVSLNTRNSADPIKNARERMHSCCFPVDQPLHTSRTFSNQMGAQVVSSSTMPLTTDTSGGSDVSPSWPPALLCQYGTNQKPSATAVKNVTPNVPFSQHERTQPTVSEEAVLLDVPYSCVQNYVHYNKQQQYLEVEAHMALGPEKVRQTESRESSMLLNVSADSQNLPELSQTTCTSHTNVSNSTKRNRHDPSSSPDGSATDSDRRDLLSPDRQLQLSYAKRSTTVLCKQKSNDFGAAEHYCPSSADTQTNSVLSVVEQAASPKDSVKPFLATSSSGSLNPAFPSNVEPAFLAYDYKYYRHPSSSTNSLGVYEKDNNLNHFISTNTVQPSDNASHASRYIPEAGVSISRASLERLPSSQPSLITETIVAPVPYIGNPHKSSSSSSCNSLGGYNTTGTPRNRHGENTRSPRMMWAGKSRQPKSTLTAAASLDTADVSPSPDGRTCSLKQEDNSGSYDQRVAECFLDNAQDSHPTSPAFSKSSIFSHASLSPVSGDLRPQRASLQTDLSRLAVASSAPLTRVGEAAELSLEPVTDFPAKVTDVLEPVLSSVSFHASDYGTKQVVSEIEGDASQPEISYTSESNRPQRCFAPTAYPNGRSASQTTRMLHTNRDFSTSMTGGDTLPPTDVVEMVSNVALRQRDKVATAVQVVPLSEAVINSISLLEKPPTAQDRLKVLHGDNVVHSSSTPSLADANTVVAEHRVPAILSTSLEHAEADDDDDDNDDEGDVELEGHSAILLQDDKLQSPEHRGSTASASHRHLSSLRLHKQAENISPHSSFASLYNATGSDTPISRNSSSDIESSRPMSRIRKPIITLPTRIRNAPTK